MKWVCCGSCDHHMTFTAVETLYTLLARDKNHTDTARTSGTVLCPDISSISRDTSFIGVNQLMP